MDKGEGNGGGSSGKMNRYDWEIFRDDLRGKLGEVALRNYMIRDVRFFVT